ncbi:MAG: hypothetical protein H7249_03240 [Chitinophagaceae bacterium]|nr:hypothetical protein [Oligoflexus sp.]
MSEVFYRILRTVAKQRLSYSFTNNYLPTRMTNQGVMSTKDIPVYHYRDDGLPVWAAIHDWVANYVNIYYPNEGLLATDFELQSWAAEIGSTMGGRVKYFAANGGIKDRAQLVDTLTMIIWTAGPQHAAVNFPQITDLTFVPAGPMAGYRPAPAADGMTEQDYLDFLPPLDVAMKSFQSLFFLGAVNHTNLGMYAPSHFMDARVKIANAGFLAQLTKIEASIIAKNLTRTKYTHLMPSNIPQSTNI